MSGYCGCRTAENEDGNISARIDRSCCGYAELQAQLAEANRCWNGSLEVQAELEAQIANLRRTIARQVLTIGQYQSLRHKCPHPCDSCKEFERSSS